MGTKSKYKKLANKIVDLIDSYDALRGDDVLAPLREEDDFNEFFQELVDLLASKEK